MSITASNIEIHVLLSYNLTQYPCELVAVKEY